MIGAISVASQTIPRRLARVAKFRHELFKHDYPILSNTLVFKELLKNAFFTRLAVGLARVHVNRPLEGRKSELTKGQKWQSFCERIFVEIIGIPLQMVSMFSVQEGLARLLEKKRGYGVPSAKQIDGWISEFDKTVQDKNKCLAPYRRPFNAKALSPAELKKYTPEELAQFKDTLVKDIYDAFRAKRSNVKPLTEYNSLIGAQIYDSEAVKHTLGSIKFDKAELKLAIDEFPGFVYDKFLRRLNRGALWTMASGILTGAIVGGYMVQWLNDNVISTKVIPSLLTKAGIIPKNRSRQIVMDTQLPSLSQRTYEM